MRDFALGPEAPDWRVAAADMVTAADDPALDVVLRDRGERTTLQTATGDEYEGWFRGELLPRHEQTWGLALQSLVRHGHALRRAPDEYIKHTFSTGALAIEEPRHVGADGADTMVPAIRVSVRRNDDITPKVRRMIDKGRKEGRLADTATALGTAIRGSGIDVEAFMASTSRDRLHFGIAYPLQEVAYPRTRRERQWLDYYDEKSTQRVREAMKDPDVQAFYLGLDAFYHPQWGCTSASMVLRPPEVWVPEGFKRDGVGFGQLEAAKAKAHQEMERVVRLGEMLLEAERCGPLRRQPAFNRLRAKN